MVAVEKRNVGHAVVYGTRRMLLTQALEDWKIGELPANPDVLRHASLNPKP